jgi:hypothetical protein
VKEKREDVKGHMKENEKGMRKTWTAKQKRKWKGWGGGESDRKQKTAHRPSCPPVHGYSKNTITTTRHPGKHLPSVVSLLDAEQRRWTKHETRTMLRRSRRTPATDTLTMMMKGISPFTSSTLSMARA